MPASPNLVADAIVTAIRGIGLETAEGEALASASVMKLKTPSLPDDVQPPAVVVAVGEGGEGGETEEIDAFTKLNRYPVTVAIFTAAGGSLLGDDETVREWRVEIEEVVDDRGRATFATVPGFNKVSTMGRVPFDPVALRDDLNMSSQRFTVEVLETRAT